MGTDLCCVPQLEPAACLGQCTKATGRFRGIWFLRLSKIGRQYWVMLLIAVCSERLTEMCVKSLTANAASRSFVLQTPHPASYKCPLRAAAR